MDKATIRRLNEINRTFYRDTAQSFDRTRGTPWPGWTQLLPYLQEHDGSPLRVLDIGCGNGRFGAYLIEQLPGEVIYHGIDNNDTLLEAARAALAGYENLTFTLEERDVVLEPPEDGAYDLVVAFGLLHHIPGYTERQAFLQQCATYLKSGGLLVFAAWRFYAFERFRKRVIPWPDDLAVSVEPGDYLLDWRHEIHARRYCHYVDDDEHNALINATGLKHITTYTADGATGTMNRYSILQR